MPNSVMHNKKARKRISSIGEITRVFRGNERVSVSKGFSLMLLLVLRIYYAKVNNAKVGGEKHPSRELKQTVSAPSLPKSPKTKD